jgi:hypothetical protein
MAHRREGSGVAVSESTKTEEELLDEQLAAIAKARAVRKGAEDVARKRQQVVDMAALSELEEEHGHNRVLRIDIEGWKSGAGAATLVAVLLPERRDAKFKRFQQELNKERPDSPKRIEAADRLARSCIVYPDPKDEEHGGKALFEATIELAPGLLTHVANQIDGWATGKAIEEGKGGRSA